MTEPPTSSSDQSSREKDNKFLKLAFTIVAALGVIFGAYSGIVLFVDSRIESYLESRDLKEALLRETKKYLVFDGKGVIRNDPLKISDEWIEEIRVEKTDRFGDVPAARIEIQFKKHLQFQPILHSYQLAGDVFADRVDTHTWAFELFSLMGLNKENQGKDLATESSYLLQILD